MAEGRAMSRLEAKIGQAQMMCCAKRMARIAANTSLRWGVRYQAAVTGDHCLDVAKEYEAYIRDFCGGLDPWRR
ncbi:MAG: hypothetical protein NVS3B5_02130 [Sphingomicrobium sp.]